MLPNLFLAKFSSSKVVFLRIIPRSVRAYPLSSFDYRFKLSNGDLSGSPAANLASPQFIKEQD